MRKTKNSYFSNLETKMSWIVGPFGKQLVLSLETDRQKVKITLLMRVLKTFLMTKSFVKDLTPSSNVVSNLDIPNPSNYFKEEKFHPLSAINKNLEFIFSFKKTTLEEEVKDGYFSKVYIQTLLY